MKRYDSETRQKAVAMMEDGHGERALSTTLAIPVSIARRSALKRVISALLDLDSRHRTIIDGSLVIDFDLSQQYLADYLNLSRLTVNKCIRRLTDEGLVRCVNDRYSIPDCARLEKIPCAHGLTLRAWMDPGAGVSPSPGPVHDGVNDRSLVLHELLGREDATAGS